MGTQPSCCEIRQPPQRYGVIEVVGLSELYSFPRVADFQQAHRHWVTEALSAESIIRAGPTRGRGTVEEVRQFRF